MSRCFYICFGVSGFRRECVWESSSELLSLDLTDSVEHLKYPTRGSEIPQAPGLDSVLRSDPCLDPKGSA